MFDLPALERILAKFKDLHILVVGDLMLDRYLLGTVKRVSPEAPVPVLDYDMTDNRPGGAANVALNVAGLGARVSTCAIVGHDQEGEILIDQMNQAGLTTDQIIRSPDRITTLKTRVMAQKQHLLRVDREDSSDIHTGLEDELLEQVRHLLHSTNIDGIIFQDYNKGCLTSRVIRATLALARSTGTRSYVDPKFYNVDAYQGITLLKPNLAELQSNVPFKIEINPEGLARASKYMRDQLSCSKMLITLSDQGIYFDDGTYQSHQPVVRRVIEDVCGAGDTVISFAALADLAGLAADELAWWSGFAGTVSCQYAGVKPISSEILQKEVQTSAV